MSQEQYDKVCKDHFMAIQQKQDEFMVELKSINQRLYIDNGKPCIQSRLNRNERLLSVAIWVTVVVCATSLTQITRSIISHFADKHSVTAEK